MRRLLIAATLIACASPALAERIVPFCPVPHNGLMITLQFGIGGPMSESERAAFYEQQLRGRGIHASNTRFWNGCLQTFVREGGHETMQFFDPYTLERIELER